MRASPVLALALLVLWALPGPPLDAQVRPIYDRGAAGLLQALQRLQTTASALHTGAHPDDEDSAFMARTARGDHARVAYLSLNRGEGGQNIIGPELLEALGVIRTEELLQARRLDGGGQFFTRAYDFGYSKTLAETAARWDEQAVLGDMVRIIRQFRPLVIYSRFAGTPADGHGHHQFAGYLTPLAFAAAGDPQAFVEQFAEGLRPWQARKLYRGSGLRPDPTDLPTLQLPTGIFDPVLGRSYAAIAAEGRSLHRSQQMGSLELLGPLATGLRLVESRVRSPADEQSIFDGLDTTVNGIASLAGLPPGTIEPELRAMADAARAARDGYRPLEPQHLAAPLAAGLQATRTARAVLADTAALPIDARAEADFLLAIKEDEFTDALVQTAGVIVDPLAGAEAVPQGATVSVDVRTFIAPWSPARVAGVRVQAPDGWVVDAMTSTDVAVGRERPSHTAAYRVHIPADAAPTQPYYLEQPRAGDLYQWPAGAAATEPFAAPLLTAIVALDIAGVMLDVARPVQYRVADGIRGEQRRDVNVVPAVTVGIDSPLYIVPTGPAAHEQRVVVRALSFSTERITGTLHLQVPDGWQVSPPAAPFTLDASGQQTAAAFVVTLPAARTPGRAALTAEAVVGDQRFARDVQVVAYPHIQTHRLYTPAVAAVEVIDLRVAPVHVGYIMGSGDQVPLALRRMGVTVTMIEADGLATGDLSQFDTIVVGIRASETRPDFVANHDRLLQFVERGGTLIVQYQQIDYGARGLPPYPARSSFNVRVTDETAPVRLLEPQHPAFTFPNRIADADFDGWVQERNLYAFEQFDDRYVPLLESADPGEPPQRGGQLYAAVGRGHYIYTSYSWFRQLPAGVPGAYRQFANLISLGRLTP